MDKMEMHEVVFFPVVRVTCSRREEIPCDPATYCSNPGRLREKFWPIGDAVKIPLFVMKD